jgi:protein-tyrosine phosphatase
MEGGARRSLQSDLAALSAAGVTDVLLLATAGELRRELKGRADLRPELAALGIALHWHPCGDGQVLEGQPLEGCWRELGRLLARGRRVVLQCRDGLGRSCALLAAVLRARRPGLSLERALARVQAVRGSRAAVQTVRQYNFVAELGGPRLRALGDALGLGPPIGGRDGDGGDGGDGGVGGGSGDGGDGGGEDGGENGARPGAGAGGIGAGVPGDSGQASGPMETTDRSAAAAGAGLPSEGAGGRADLVLWGAAAPAGAPAAAGLPGGAGSGQLPPLRLCAGVATVLQF